LVEWLKMPAPPMPGYYPDPLDQDDIEAVAKYVEGLH